MRRHGTGLWDRQDILPALLACLGVGLVALENAETVRGWYRRARGAAGRPHLQSACADLQANFERLAAAELDTPFALSRLDTKALSGNLVAAERELQRARRKAGVPGVNGGVRHGVEAAEAHTAYQAAVVEAFQLPDGGGPADLSDAYLADLLDELADVDGTGQGGLVPMDGSPYHAEAHAQRLDRLGRSLSVDGIADGLDHRPDELVRIVEDGLAWVGVRESVYLKLGAHLNVPVIHEAVRDAEAAIAEDADPQAAGELRTAFADILAEAGFGGLDALPDELAEVSVGGVGSGSSLTVGELDRSYGRFASAFVSFLHALDAAAGGDTAGERELWQDGREALDTAYARQPFDALAPP